MKKFVEIYTDYVDDNGVRHLDGYTTFPDCDDYISENEEGTVIAYIFNRQVYYTNPEYQFDDYVVETIELLKKEGIVD